MLWIWDVFPVGCWHGILSFVFVLLAPWFTELYALSLKCETGQVYGLNNLPTSHFKMLIPLSQHNMVGETYCFLGSSHFLHPSEGELAHHDKYDSRILK